MQKINGKPPSVTAHNQLYPYTWLCLCTCVRQSPLESICMLFSRGSVRCNVPFMKKSDDCYDFGISEQPNLVSSRLKPIGIFLVKKENVGVIKNTCECITN